MGQLLERSEEVEALGTALDRAEPVAVLGEPGIGKTSVLRQATQRGDHAICWGAGLATLTWRSYLALSRAVGSLPDADADTIVEIVAERVGDGVLVLDDLHWADEDTIAIVGELGSRVRIAVAIRAGDHRAPRVEKAVADAGFQVRHLEALSDAAAAELVRRTNAGLSNVEVARAVDGAGGNPLLLEELARSGEVAGTLRLAVAARLATSSPEAKDSLLRLALLGRPAEADLVGRGLDDLLAAGLAERDDRALVRPRHALLGEVALASASAAEQAATAAALATAVIEPGEAARLLVRAGDVEAARERALEAAEDAPTPGERALHLGLAASCASGPHADDLRLTAARELVGAGRFEEGDKLALGVESDEPIVRAEALLWHGHARAQLADFREAERAFTEAVALAAGSRTRVEVRLRIELAKRPLDGVWDPQRALVLAAEAWDLASDVGYDVARARGQLGSAHYSAALPGWDDHFRAAIELALADGDTSMALNYVNNRQIALYLHGDPESAMEAATDGIDQARRAGMRGWELELAMALVLARVQVLADYAGAIPECEALLERPVKLRHRDVICALLGWSLACLGRDGDALRVLDLGLARRNDPVGVAAIHLARACTHWLAGRPAEAVTASDACFGTGLIGYPTLTWCEPLHAWAVYESTGTYAPARGQTPFRSLAGAAPECAGVAALAASDLEAAEREFRDAAAQWVGFETLAELRTLLAAGEVATRLGALDRARATLTEVEERAVTLGLAPMLGRARRALRAAGVHAAAARGRADGAVTSREREVLALVGDGRSTKEIAARLSLATSTVDAMVRSAMRKLGATTRVQASALAAHTPAGSRRD